MISSLVIALIIIILLPASSTLIPYTTLFRSDPGLRGTGHARLPSERLGKGTPQSLYRGGSGSRSRRSQAELALSVGDTWHGRSQKSLPTPSSITVFASARKKRPSRAARILLILRLKTPQTLEPIPYVGRRTRNTAKKFRGKILSADRFPAELPATKSGFHQKRN